MKKKILLRCLVGAPIGLAISYIITIVISICFGNGAYYAVSPALIADFGTEIRAVVMQAVFSLAYGAAFGGASVIWETEWSLLRMTATHLAICSIATFPTAWLMRWMDRSVGGVLAYFGIFIAIYVGIWISMYCGIKSKLRSMNRKVNELR